MRISTRSRYGIRLMINLAVNYSRGYSLLKDIAKDEEISEKYLSQIVIPLRRAGLLTATRGINGGYMLSSHPSNITAGQIVEILEGDLCVIECIRDEDNNICARSGNCASRELWEGLGDKIRSFLNSVTLEELAKSKLEKEQQMLEYSI